MWLWACNVFFLFFNLGYYICKGSGVCVFFFKYRIEGVFLMAQACEKELSTNVSVPSFATEQCTVENMKPFELWFPAL